MLKDTQPSDYVIDLRLGARTIGPAPPNKQQSYSGSNGLVYRCSFQEARFVLKVMWNVYGDQLTADLLCRFQEEVAVQTRLRDQHKRCDNVLSLLHHRTAQFFAGNFPGWPEGPDVLRMEKTLFVAAPFLPLDLQQLTRLRKEMRRVPPFFEDKGTFCVVLCFLILLLRKELWEIMRGMLCALRFLWKNLVSHRDVKSDNVMLKRENGCWIPVLIDLGTAIDWCSEGVRRENEPFMYTGGNPGGAAITHPPEILSTTRPVDRSKQDLYALGKMFGCIMTINPLSNDPKSGAPEWEQPVSLRTPSSQSFSSNRLDRQARFGDLPSCYHAKLRALVMDLVQPFGLRPGFPGVAERVGFRWWSRAPVSDAVHCGVLCLLSALKHKGIMLERRVIETILRLLDSNSLVQPWTDE